MTSHLGTLAIAVLVLAASSGCAHRTTTVHTSDTVRTDTSQKEIAPPPVVEETTVIKRSHTTTEQGQQ